MSEFGRYHPVESFFNDLQIQKMHVKMILHNLSGKTITFGEGRSTFKHFDVVGDQNNI